MALPSVLRPFGRWPDPRSSREVEDEIREELRFHLEMRVAEFVKSGMPEAEARAQAERRFGDFDKTVQKCRRIQMAERVVLQRIQLGMLVGLLGAVVYLVFENFDLRKETASEMRNMREQLQAVQQKLAENDGNAGVEVLPRNLNLVPGPRQVIDPLIGGLSPAAPAKGQKPAADPENFLARLNAATNWREGVEIAQEIAALKPEEGLRVMRSIFSRIESSEIRRQMLKAFVFASHPDVLEVLHLGASDPDAPVRSWAFNYLKDYAFADFSADEGAYESWRRQVHGLSIDRAVAMSANDFVSRLKRSDNAAAETTFRQLRNMNWDRLRERGVDVSRVLIDAGVLTELGRWVDAGSLEAQVGALEWISRFDADEEFLGKTVLPVALPASGAPERVRQAAWEALGKKGRAWVFEPLLENFRKTPADARMYSAARLLGDLEDPRAIPEMIGRIESDNSYWTIYGVGYFGLGKLTGVAYDESHDGAWWRLWWEKNRHRFPENVRDAAIPKLSIGR